MAGDEEERFEGEPSKSQRKRDAQAVQDLGARLVELPAARLARLPLDEDVRRAVAEARALKRGGARKRQIKYLGKLLRQSDPAPIEAALSGLQEQGRRETALQHRIEGWRDRLIEDGDPAVEALLEEHPQADVQRLRQLLRKARAERDAQRPPAGARALFRALRELLSEPPG